jgi:4-alpha-glucanotransferase
MSKENLKIQLAQTLSHDKWERIGARKRSGILIPLFSVYSKNSFGIGDLGDLKILIDWCRKSGNSIIQLLPLNEVGHQFCPYDALSSFALEPAYLNFKSIPGSKSRSIDLRLRALAKDFPNGKPKVDYRIKEEKIGILRDIYLADKNAGSQELSKFKEENTYWLDDFALFKTLKGHQLHKPWYNWEGRYKNRDHQELKIFREEHSNEINFQVWLQWQLYKQLKQVKDICVHRGILLKGDLPLLVSRDSADVWAHPEFFKLEYAAGAPPDMYCAKGQRWGMPTYNWDSIAGDGYRYLKAKLKFAENFYDILRIDHVVGLFRIWSINYSEPEENKGLNGFFDPRDENKWGLQGKHILSVMLSSTRMLLCAEDLGMIPEVCTKALVELGIPGNDVQRWVKDWKVAHDFLSPDGFREISVAMLSTHDTTNWPAWWENEAGTVDESLFIRKCLQYAIDYNRVGCELFEADLSRHARLRWRNAIDTPEIFLKILEKKKQEAPDLFELYLNSFREKEKLWALFKLTGAMREKSDREIVSAALKLTLDSLSVFCIQLFTDWLFLAGIFKGDSYDYRINTPGTIGADNWSLVIPIPLEDLLKHKVTAQIKGIISSSGRI